MSFKPRVLFGVATISLSYINDELGRRFPGDPDRRGWHDVLPVRLGTGSVFGAVIVANMVVARFVKDPTNPRFIWRAVPIQLSGLFVLIAGNLLWPHVWLWSVLGTSLYAFGIGLIFPTLFRFTLFTNNLPKGTVSASLNMVILAVMAVSVGKSVADCGLTAAGSRFTCWQSLRSGGGIHVERVVNAGTPVSRNGTGNREVKSGPPCGAVF